MSPLIHIVESSGREVVRELQSSDLPGKMSFGCVGQFYGNVPFNANVGVPAVVNHIGSLIVQPTVLTVISLNPFIVQPRREGYYLVHHKRDDYIYPALFANYEVTLRISGALNRGMIAEINDTTAITTGGDHDRCKTELTGIVYCNGTTDTITLTVEHTALSTRTFGNISAANSRVHTSIAYVGWNTEHGAIP